MKWCQIRQNVGKVELRSGLELNLHRLEFRVKFSYVDLETWSIQVDSSLVQEGNNSFEQSRSIWFCFLTICFIRFINSLLQNISDFNCFILLELRDSITINSSFKVPASPHQAYLEPFCLPV